jgi:hypothetical protein
MYFGYPKPPESDQLQVIEDGTIRAARRLAQV